MIVRDEAPVIERCLRSVAGLVDSWVVCDTGSADGTQELVERSLKGVPGRLWERPWRDFGHNRCELMRLARGCGDYLLLLDADMTVTFDRAGLVNLTADSYLIRHVQPVEFWIKRLVKSDREWSYVGSVHEYLTTEPLEVVERLDAIVVHHHYDSRPVAEKLERDLSLLLQDVKQNSANARAVFYLAQTYSDLGRRDEAIGLYERRAAMGGWDQEVFYAMLRAGVLRAEIGDWPAAMATLVSAWEFRPSRLEPLYELASRLRVRGEHQTAYLFAQRGIDRPQPEDILFVWPWVYRWGLLFEYSIGAYWAGEYRTALAACEQLLSLPDLPEEYREHTVRNLALCIDRLRGRSPRTETTTGDQGK